MMSQDRYEVGDIYGLGKWGWWWRLASLPSEFCLGPGTAVKLNFMRNSVHFSLLFSLGHLPVVITFEVKSPYNLLSKAMTQTIITRWLNGSLVWKDFVNPFCHLAPCWTLSNPFPRSRQLYFGSFLKILKSFLKAVFEVRCQPYFPFLPV